VLPAWNHTALIVLFYVDHTSHWCYFAGGQEEWDEERPLYEKDGKVTELMKFWIGVEAKGKEEQWTITKQEPIRFLNT
jgi:hypothetical protein